MNVNPASLLKTLPGSGLNRLFLGILVASVALGALSGYILSKSGNPTPATATLNQVTGQTPQSAAQDSKTFKDFAEGTIEPKPTPSNGNDVYSEGTHLLVRSGGAQPVALTSSVVDLNQYVGKKVKVYGETQKALQEGWLMDVGKVEVEQ